MEKEWLEKKDKEEKKELRNWKERERESEENKMRMINKEKGWKEKRTKNRKKQSIVLLSGSVFYYDCCSSIICYFK